MKNIPNKIYLQIGEETPKDADFEELDEVTWCADKINDNDVEYTRIENAKKAFSGVCMILSSCKNGKCDLHCHCMRSFVRRLKENTM